LTVAGAERSSAVLKHANWPNAELALCASRRAVSSVIEDLFVRRLIRGKPSKSADGVFFNNLKLTDKGVRAAIQERNRRTLPEKVKQFLDVAALIRGDAEKK
jgi:hypothetical protein